MLFRNDGEKRDGPPPLPATRVVPLLPLRDIIVFPHMVVPLFVGREKSIAALEEAMRHEKDILLSAQKRAKTNEPTPEDIHTTGTLGTVVQLLRLPDGQLGDHLDEATQAITLAIDGGGPGTWVIAPWRSDGHPDHTAAGDAAATAVASSASLCRCTSPRTLPSTCTPIITVSSVAYFSS